MQTTQSTLTPKQAWKIIGGLSKPSKMPGYSYSIPAEECGVGSKLRKIAGSVCSKCYALKGFYVYPNSRKALRRRFESLNDPRWVEAMIVAFGHYEKGGYARIHDAGDIQSVEHLTNICKIAEALPHIKFWLPTRENRIVGQYLIKNKKGFPKNLTIRLSASMLDSAPPVSIAKAYGVQTSGVQKTGFTCPASKQGNKCLDCRMCWSKKVKNVNYKQH